MKICREIDNWKAIKETLPKDKTLGVVMTMGALHSGHASLIKQSQKDNDYTLVSIFVNPTQFNDKKDFNHYPNTWESDIHLLKSLNVDFVLSPHKEALYHDNYHYQISEKHFSHILCGRTRPGHFDGVLTIVMKLLLISGATRAYFGEKDYQQYQLIKKMAEAFFVPTKIISCPTVREETGLALSSRNLRLNNQAKEKAIRFAHIIQSYHCLADAITQLEKENIQIDYLEEHNQRRYAAVFIDGVRLIDNFPISEIHMTQDKEPS